MADITMNMRGPMDGLHTQELVAELEGIGSVEAVYPDEMRGYIPEFPEVVSQIVITLATTLSVAGVRAAVLAVRKWVRGKRSRHEKLERSVKMYGPDGKLIDLDDLR